MAMFTVSKMDMKTKARCGVFTIGKRVIETPSYVIVGTYGNVRTLDASDFLPTKTQIIISNTYHLWKTLGEDLDSFEGLHKRLGFDGLIMTDSGGYQVFSLGARRENMTGKFGNNLLISSYEQESESRKVLREMKESFKNFFIKDKNIVRISDRGVFFYDEGERFLDSETSIRIQEKLGADIILPLDVCTSSRHSWKYNKKAMELTRAWALRSISIKKNPEQMLYGIIQGGSFPDLRKASARFITDHNFDGYAIGGSFGGTSKGEMTDVLDWIIPYLKYEKPTHLLGVGKINDLFEGVERGVDTFDCVIPTREARHGSLWTANGRFNITKAKYADDARPIEVGCLCPACSAGIKKKDLYGLFKAKDQKAGYYATVHNVFFFNSLMEQIRNSIKENRFLEFKNEFLSRLK